MRKQAHQDDPQQAAVAELPHFVDLVLQTDDEGKEGEKKETEKFHAGIFLTLDEKGLAYAGDQSVITKRAKLRSFSHPTKQSSKPLSKHHDVQFRYEEA